MTMPLQPTPISAVDWIVKYEQLNFLVVSQFVCLNVSLQY
jgi:hypothetical protein